MVENPMREDYVNIGLVFLSYNEVDGLQFYLPRLSEICRQNEIQNVFAVDGGSSDGSIELYEKYRLPYYIQEKRGRGEAFKLAFANSNDDALIFFSPDGNEDINDITQFCFHLRDETDIVIASRMMKESKNEEDDQFFRWRKWANQSFTFVANMLWNWRGPYITDSINGFRAFRRGAWDQLNISASDYSIEYQSTIRAFKRKLKIVEFPTKEGKRIGGESYAKSLPTGIRFIKLLAGEILIFNKF
jgi:glycosyltransferase involved in cell wall biosynthesis